jgi:hypothetical protein
VRASYAPKRGICRRMCSHHRGFSVTASPKQQAVVIVNSPAWVTAAFEVLFGPLRIRGARRVGIEPTLQLSKPHTYIRPPLARTVGTVSIPVC